MRRVLAVALLAAALVGCNDNDATDAPDTEEEATP